jgi:Flp pilus assembly protein TadD
VSLDEGVRLYRQADYRGALDVFLNLHVDSADYPELSYYLGLCYTRLEKYDEALLYLEQVATSDLDFAQVFQSRLLLGYIYAVTERYRLAEYEFERLLEDGIDSAKVRAAAAYARYLQGKVDEAIADLEQALSLEADNANALNSLGYVLADSGRDTVRAVECCRKAVELSPRRAAYWDSLGWALWLRGDREGAHKCLLRARSLAPHDGEIREHLEAIGVVAS